MGANVTTYCPECYLQYNAAKPLKMQGMSLCSGWVATCLYKLLCQRVSELCERRLGGLVRACRL